MSAFSNSDTHSAKNQLVNAGDASYGRANPRQPHGMLARRFGHGYNCTATDMVRAADQVRKSK